MRPELIWRRASEVDTLDLVALDHLRLGGDLGDHLLPAVADWRWGAGRAPPAPPTVCRAPQDLPDDLRRSLAVSGSRYSDNPGSRIVFLNGQVFREGDQPMPGVTVERIGLKSVILAARGQRYELKY